LPATRSSAFSSWAAVRGRMTRQLTKAFPDAAITAVDISPEMIAHARSAVAGVDFYVADAEAFIRAASEPYNLVISNAAVQWFEDARASLIGARALLAHDGLLVVSTFGDRTFHELRHAFDAAYAVAEMELEQHVVLMNTPTYWREVFPECEVLEEISTRGFASVAAFLHSIQEAGAVNSTAGPHFLSRRILREMIDQYSKRYADPNRGGITATYHIVYLYCHAESNGKPP
jgi:malonyl-CoA O-methyltransferase